MRHFLGAVFSCAVFGAAFAEEPARPAQVGGYSPDLAELMIGAQLRHFKLAFAGRVQNWDFAEFEALQLRKNFTEAAKSFPEFKNVQVAKLLQEYSAPALEDIGKAIKDKDFRAFRTSFERLTTACNSCHQAAGMGFIKIRVPTASPFSNQLYEPTR